MRTMAMIVLALACSGAHAADAIFKCKAADGSTVFASKPCGADASEVKVRPAPTPDPAAPAPVASTVAPTTSTATTSDADARREADNMTADCYEGVRRLDSRILEVRDHDYASDIAFATSAQIAQARQRDMQPLLNARRSQSALCEQRWHDTYNAARYR